MRYARRYRSGTEFQNRCMCQLQLCYRNVELARTSNIPRRFEPFVFPQSSGNAGRDTLRRLGHAGCIGSYYTRKRSSGSHTTIMVPVRKPETGWNRRYCGGPSVGARDPLRSKQHQRQKIFAQCSSGHGYFPPVGLTCSGGNFQSPLHIVHPATYIDMHSNMPSCTRSFFISGVRRS